MKTFYLIGFVLMIAVYPTQTKGGVLDINGRFSYLLNNDSIPKENKIKKNKVFLALPGRWMFNFWGYERRLFGNKQNFDVWLSTGIFPSFRTSIKDICDKLSYGSHPLDLSENDLRDRDHMDHINEYVTYDATKRWCYTLHQELKWIYLNKQSFLRLSSSIGYVYYHNQFNMYIVEKYIIKRPIIPAKDEMYIKEYPTRTLYLYLAPIGIVQQRKDKPWFVELSAYYVIRIGEYNKTIEPTEIIQYPDKLLGYDNQSIFAYKPPKLFMFVNFRIGYNF